MLPKKSKQNTADTLWPTHIYWVCQKMVVTKAGYYINKRGLIQVFMAGVAQMTVFLVLTPYRVRNLTVMFQRNMLPPSSGWLSLVQVVVEVIGWRNSAYCIGNLHEQLTDFVLPVISASMWMKFGGPEDGGSSFLWNLGRNLSYYRMLEPRKLIVWTKTLIVKRGGL